jgi:hypothetical protein
MASSNYPQTADGVAFRLQPASLWSFDDYGSWAPSRELLRYMHPVWGSNYWHLADNPRAPVSVGSWTINRQRAVPWLNGSVVR